MEDRLQQAAIRRHLRDVQTDQVHEWTLDHVQGHLLALADESQQEEYLLRLLTNFWTRDDVWQTMQSRVDQGKLLRRIEANESVQKELDVLEEFLSNDVLLETADCTIKRFIGEFPDADVVRQAIRGLYAPLTDAHRTVTNKLLE